MLKVLKNNYIISAVILISSLLITFVLCLKSSLELSVSYFLQNELIVIITIIGVVLCEGVFLLSTDSIVCRNKKFKERFFYITKSLWISQCTLLPAVLCLILVNIFIDLNLSTINKILVFVISYLSQLVLFFSYKFVTDCDWNTTIKVVASNCVLTLLLSMLLKLV